MCRVYAENRSLCGFRAWLYADNKLTKPAQIVGFLLGQKLKLQNHDDDELDHELYDPWDKTTNIFGVQLFAVESDGYILKYCDTKEDAEMCIKEMEEDDE